MRIFLSTAVVLAAAGVAAHVAAPGPRADAGRIELIASVNHAVSVASTSATGLYPGATRTMTLGIRNTYAFAVKITAVKAKVAAATSRPGCAGTRANLLVSHRGGAFVIKPKKVAPGVVMTVVMPETVADACQGATFKITFTARAVRA